MSNLTRETAFVPLLGSSNGLFLAITAVFFCFCMGPVPKEPKTKTFHVIFVRKQLSLKYLSHAGNLPILGAPMPLLPLTRPNTPETAVLP